MPVVEAVALNDQLTAINRGGIAMRASADVLAALTHACVKPILRVPFTRLKCQPLSSKVQPHSPEACPGGHVAFPATGRVG